MRSLLLLFAVILGCGPDPADMAKNLESENPVIREDTAKIAHNFDSPEVRSALVEALDDEAEMVRFNAIKSLVELEETQAVSKLVEMLETEESPKVHREVIDALGQLQQVEAVPALIAHIERNMDPKPPLNAIWALGFLEDNQSLALLSALAEHEDPYVAWNSKKALASLRP
jgi:HEAT repeat protein